MERFISTMLHDNNQAVPLLRGWKQFCFSKLFDDKTYHPATSLWITRFLPLFKYILPSFTSYNSTKLITIALKPIVIKLLLPCRLMLFNQQTQSNGNSFFCVYLSCFLV